MIFYDLKTFFFSWSLSWLRACFLSFFSCFLVFFYKISPQLAYTLIVSKLGTDFLLSLLDTMHHIWWIQFKTVQLKKKGQYFLITLLYECHIYVCNKTKNILSFKMWYLQNVVCKIVSNMLSDLWIYFNISNSRAARIFIISWMNLLCQ